MIYCQQKLVLYMNLHYLVYCSYLRYSNLNAWLENYRYFFVLPYVTSIGIFNGISANLESTKKRRNSQIRNETKANIGRRRTDRYPQGFEIEKVRYLKFPNPVSFRDQRFSPLFSQVNYDSRKIHSRDENKIKGI